MVAGRVGCGRVVEEKKGFGAICINIKTFFFGLVRGVKGGQWIEEQRQSWIHKITPSSPSASSGSVAAISTRWRGEWRWRGLFLKFICNSRL